jgi:uncharacterized membrane protein
VGVQGWGGVCGRGGGGGGLFSVLLVAAVAGDLVHAWTTSVGCASSTAQYMSGPTVGTGFGVGEGGDGVLNPHLLAWRCNGR